MFQGYHLIQVNGTLIDRLLLCTPDFPTSFQRANCGWSEYTKLAPTSLNIPTRLDSRAEVDQTSILHPLDRHWDQRRVLAETSGNH